MMTDEDVVKHRYCFTAHIKPDPWKLFNHTCPSKMGLQYLLKRRSVSTTKTPDTPRRIGINSQHHLIHNAASRFKKSSVASDCYNQMETSVIDPLTATDLGVMDT